MSKNFSTKNMVITALLIALGIIIPTAFGFLRITLGPFTATLTSHVPIFIAMFISPVSALFTAIGTTLGFLITTPLVVAIRAASHIVFALVGAFMLKKGTNLIVSGITTAILHGICEAVVVFAFLSTGATTSTSPFWTTVLYTTGIGTVLHHVVDYIIAIAIVKTLSKTKLFPRLPKIW